MILSESIEVVVETLVEALALVVAVAVAAAGKEAEEVTNPQRVMQVIVAE